jgi:hypothetical protein
MKRLSGLFFARIRILERLAQIQRGGRKIFHERGRDERKVKQTLEASSRFKE